MTDDEMYYAERDAALKAVADALTAAEREQFDRNFGITLPGMAGATAADVLDHTVSYDAYLDKTEPFYERFRAQVPDHVGTVFALHALVILRKTLTPGRVLALLQRAGIIGPAIYPDVRAGLLLEDGTDANHLLVEARAEQGMRAAGVPERELTEFRGAVRVTGIPGSSRNVLDIAAWVTLADEYTPLPRKSYDPTRDLAVLLVDSAEATYRARTSSELHQAFVNLQAHLDLSTAEAAEAGLRAFFDRGLRGELS